MNASLLSGLAGGGADIARIHAMQHLKTFLILCRAEPVFKYVAPIVEKAGISRAELKALSTNPDELDGKVKEKLENVFKNFDLKKIASMVPGMGDLVNLGNKGLESIKEQSNKLLGSIKPAYEQTYKSAMKVLGLEEKTKTDKKGTAKKGKVEKAGTTQKGEKVKDLIKNKKPELHFECLNICFCFLKKKKERNTRVFILSTP